MRHGPGLAASPCGWHNLKVGRGRESRVPSRSAADASLFRLGSTRQNATSYPDLADQASVACDLILYLLLLKEKEDDFESYGP